MGANRSLEARFLAPHTFAQAHDAEFLSPPHLVRLSLEIARAVVTGGRLIVSMPPRHGKSTICSQWAPAWYLSLFPRRNVMMAGYSGSYAFEWGKKVRDILNQPGMVGVSDSSSSASRWETLHGGVMYALGRGEGLTGRGGNLIIVDDPIKNSAEASSATFRDSLWQWMRTTLFTRCEPNGAIIVVMTRWHEDDLIARIEHDEKPGTWRRVVMPALSDDGVPLWPERYGEEALREIRSAVGFNVWETMYQQRPVSPEGHIIKNAWVKYYPGAGGVKDADVEIQSWDMTFGTKSDDSSFVVGEVWAKKGAEFYLVDEERGRWTFTETIAAFRRLTARNPIATRKLVEDKANGAAIIDALRREIYGIVPFSPKGDKRARIEACQPLFEAGNVLIPAEAPFTREWVAEVTAFPNGRNDDRVDTTSQALNYLRTCNSREAAILWS